MARGLIKKLQQSAESVERSVESVAQSAVKLVEKSVFNTSVFFNASASDHSRSHDITQTGNVSLADGSVLTDMGQSILMYALIIGLILLCLLLPFLGWYCRSCGLRSIPCCRRVFRAVGVDDFDDFDVMFVVHEAIASNSSGKINFCVRITAGRNTAQTEFRSTSHFQENMQLRIEQGVREVKVDFIDGWRRKIASMVFDPNKDILVQKSCTDQIFSMKTKQTGVVNPQLKLTFRVVKTADAEENGLVSGGNANSAERNLEFLVSEQLRKVGWEEKVRDPVQQLNLLASACAGPVERFGMVGEKQPAYVGVRGPPKNRGFKLGIWKEEKTFADGRDGKLEIDILRITGVKADPNRAEIFFIYYIDDNRVRQNVCLRRVDRTRDVWVKMLTMFISEVHALRAKAKDERAKDQESIEKMASMGPKDSTASRGR